MDKKTSISRYKKVRMWLNKKSSLIMLKRSKSREYLVLENFTLQMLLDGLLLSIIILPFYPFSLPLLISLGCGAFMAKRIFPSVLSLINSVNLIKVGK